MHTNTSYKVNNNIKFATVREDPNIIIPIIKAYKIKRLLTICSGGCSVLSYKAIYPQLSISVFDTNIHQIKLLEQKLQLLTNSDNPNKFQEIMALNQHGVFEDIFKCFRVFINSFITSHDELKDNLTKKQNIKEYAHNIFNNNYWDLAFKMFFSDKFLKTTFSKLAVQNAKEHSYAKYFQNCFETGILREDRAENYFLHYALLGEYLDNCRPVYFDKQVSDNNIHMFHGTIWDINNLYNYDLIDLSNILDWMELEEARAILNFLAQYVKTGCLVVFRNLNNIHNYDKLICKPFKKNNKLSHELLSKSKDLFYSAITVLEK